MLISKCKYSIWFKAISTAVVCLFLVNNLAWANPDIFSPSRATLAVHTKLIQESFKREYAARTFALAEPGEDEYIKTEIEKDRRILGDTKWENERTETLKFNDDSEAATYVERRIKELKIKKVKGLNAVKLVEITDLFKNTVQFGHVGLRGKGENFDYGMPAMYVDSRYYETAEGALWKHELDEILQWEDLRDNILDIPKELMRQWIIDNVYELDEHSREFLQNTKYKDCSSSYEIAEKIHRDSCSLEGLYRLIPDAEADNFFNYFNFARVCELYDDFAEYKGADVNISGKKPAPDRVDNIPAPGAGAAKPESSPIVFSSASEFRRQFESMNLPDHAKKKWRYIGENRTLVNGARLIEGATYYLKEENMRFNDPEGVLVKPTPSYLVQINPRNDNPHLPALVAVINSQLAGVTESDFALLFENIEGKNLTAYATSLNIRKDPDKNLGIVIKTALEVLKAYKETYYDHGYVNGDIDCEAIVVREKSEEAGRVVFVDNDTIAPVEATDSVSTKRKEFGKDKYSSAGRDKRIRNSSNPCLTKDDVYALCVTLSDFARQVSFGTSMKSKNTALFRRAIKILDKYKKLAAKPTTGDSVLTELTGAIESLEGDYKRANPAPGAGAAKPESSPIVFSSASEFRRQFEFIGLSGHPKKKWRYIGKNRTLVNGARLIEGATYYLKQGEVLPYAVDGVLVRSTPRYLAQINPQNDNPHLPALVAVIDSRLAGVTERDFALLFENIEGNNLIDYAVSLPGKKGPDENLGIVIKTALEVLKAYKETYYDHGYVNGDIDCEAIVVREKSEEAGRVVFVANDTIAPVEATDSVSVERKKTGKTAYISIDRSVRILNPLTSATDLCLTRDDVYALCVTLSDFVHQASFGTSMKSKNTALFRRAIKILDKYKQLAAKPKTGDSVLTELTGAMESLEGDYKRANPAPEAGTVKPEGSSAAQSDKEKGAVSDYPLKAWVLRNKKLVVPILTLLYITSLSTSIVMMKFTLVSCIQFTTGVLFWPVTLYVSFKSLSRLDRDAETICLRHSLFTGLFLILTAALAVGSVKIRMLAQSNVIPWMSAYGWLPNFFGLLAMIQFLIICQITCQKGKTDKFILSFTHVYLTSAWVFVGELIAPLLIKNGAVRSGTFMFGDVLAFLAAGFISLQLHTLKFVWQTSKNIPAPGAGAAKQFAVSKKGDLPDGSPYNIAKLLKTKFGGKFVKAETLRKQTKGRMPDGHLSIETVKRDLGTLHYLGLAREKVEEEKYRFADLSPPEWGFVEPILEGLGPRPSKEKKEKAKTLLQKRLTSYRLANPLIHVSEQHDDFYRWLKKMIEKGKIKKGLPLILFDYHDDAYVPGASGKGELDSSSWVYYALKNGLVSEVIWVLPPWQRRLNDTEKTIVKDRKNNIKKLKEKGFNISWRYLNQLEDVGPETLVSFDFDFFSNENLHRSSKPKIKKLTEKVFALLRNRGISVTAFDLSRTGYPFVPQNKISFIENTLKANIHRFAQTKKPVVYYPAPGAGKAKPEGSSTAKDTSGPGPEAVSPDRGNDDEEKGAHLFSAQKPAAPRTRDEEGLQILLDKKAQGIKRVRVYNKNLGEDAYQMPPIDQAIDEYKAQIIRYNNKKRAFFYEIGCEQTGGEDGEPTDDAGTVDKEAFKKRLRKMLYRVDSGKKLIETSNLAIAGIAEGKVTAEELIFLLVDLVSSEKCDDILSSSLSLRHICVRFANSLGKWGIYDGFKKELIFRGLQGGWPASVPVDPENALGRYTPGQEELTTSGKPLEFGPGLLYHLRDGLDETILSNALAGKIPLGRVVHETATSYFKSTSKSPAIFAVSAKLYNRLLNEEKATLRMKGTDPYPTINTPLTLEDVDEIWIDEDTHERYQEILQNPLSDLEKNLKPKIEYLYRIGKIKVVPGLRHTEQNPDALSHVGRYALNRDLFRRMPLFRERDAKKIGTDTNLPAPRTREHTAADTPAPGAGTATPEGSAVAFLETDTGRLLNPRHAALLRDTINNIKYPTKTEKDKDFVKELVKVAVDIESTLQLLDTRLPPAGEEGRYYTIRYDKNRLRGPPRALINAYADLLRMKLGGEDRVRVYPSSGTDNKNQPLISVRCYNSRTKTHSTLIGEGHVDSKEKLTKDTALRILDMANIAFAKANIPLGLSSGELSKYSFFISFIQARVKELTGRDLPVEDIILGNRIIMLPAITPVPKERLREYYEWAIERVNQAA